MAKQQASSMLSIFRLPADFGTFIVQPWSILTYMFFHADFRHILFNLLALYFIGRILVDFINNRQFLTIFFGGGILGGALFLLSYNLIPDLGTGEQHLVGASGGVYAVLIAAAVLVPNYEVFLFGAFRTKIKWIALFLVFMSLFFNPNNIGGSIAHLGGIFFGGLYILNLQGRINLDFLRNVRNPFKPKYTIIDERDILRGTGKGKASGSKTTRAKKGRNKPEQEEIDAILDKIGQSGYDSLSKEEKELLFRASE